MKFKTSTKISLRFTFLTTLILFWFSLLIFTLYFNTRYSKQRDFLLFNWEYKVPSFFKMLNNNHFEWQEKPKFNWNKPIFDPTDRPKFNEKSEKVENLEKSDDFFWILIPNKINQEVIMIPVQEFENIWKNINYLPFFNIFASKDTKFAIYNWKYYIYHEFSNKEIKALDVTVFVFSQFELWQLLCLRDIIFIILSFFISTYYVWNWLKKLKFLANRTENLNLDNLLDPIEIDPKAPEKDEIKIISKALNKSLKRINSQITSLRDFISNASHELKTPLMMMNTEIDIALKKKDYEKHLINIKNSTKRIADLVDSLSLIAKLEANVKFEKENSNVYSICENQIDQIIKNYTNKNINIECDDISLEKNLHCWLFWIVIKNLIENACKYAWTHADISIKFNESVFIISDNWIWIKKDDLKHIFERFWQVEKSEKWKHSFWLGLYLVKKIVELHNWEIEANSTFWEWTEFVIKW